jgi:tRNA-splicing ligase RtcB (3'-phosphate/5'-hydroxy nucleic acid ligase)
VSTKKGRALTGRVVALSPPGLPPDPRAMRTLARIERTGLLAAPPVALPDLHVKPRLETPSSTATATRDTLVLGLTSPSPNCGMALARTALTAADLNPASLDALFRALAQRLSPDRTTPSLTPDELLTAMQHGATAAVDWYGLDRDTPQYMDQQGNALAREVDTASLERAIPPTLLEIARREFGQVGRGNHFLELQVIDEIHDAAIASAWGLAEEQIVVMYHADSGRLGAFVGRLYAHRRKNNWRGRLIELRVKVPFQFVVGPWARLGRRIGYHFLPRRWTPIPANSEEGQRTILALQAAANYAYANRVAVLAALRDAMQEVWGSQLAPPALIWDAPHNGIYYEALQPDGPTVWIHRHNAARVAPAAALPANSPYRATGQPVLLPGTERTSSYLCVSGAGAASTLNSASHGAGQLANLLGQPLANAATTRVYGYDGAEPVEQAHLSQDGVTAVLDLLAARDVLRPVARLRPIAGLKG